MKYGRKIKMSMMNLSFSRCSDSIATVFTPSPSPFATWVSESPSSPQVWLFLNPTAAQCTTWPLVIPTGAATRHPNPCRVCPRASGSSRSPRTSSSSTLLGGVSRASFVSSPLSPVSLFTETINCKLPFLLPLTKFFQCQNFEVKNYEYCWNISEKWIDYPWNLWQKESNPRL